ncbi:hypothetical protein MJO52_09335 [Microbulbifer variabilis]|uniref:Uncharacterized protein n=1 Tax=Microbulbifer variabilis TaxID=266805 RepID=A0ABY4VN91_9GAMM|nr:ABC-three component system middle component 1 [Microbulbifer variabilis]USD23319.1 hypothetical protein MJO52_09335 [Microbulbifer variabilis]
MSDLNKGVFVMHNKYALAACCILPDSVNNIEVSLQSMKEDMHNFVRSILSSLESQRGLIVDGYLLIILSKEPNSDIREVIQELEQDTKVCRKHVLWPSSDGSGLERAQYVTVLSLPKPLSSVSQPMSSFSLSTNAEKLLLEYKKQGNLDRLMDSIKNGVLRDADR